MEAGSAFPLNGGVKCQQQEKERRRAKTGKGKEDVKTRIIIKWLGYTAGSWWLWWNYLDILGVESILDVSGLFLLLWYFLLGGPILLLFPVIAKGARDKVKMIE